MQETRAKKQQKKQRKRSKNNQLLHLEEVATKNNY